MRLEWVRPADGRPLPAVIVHPEAGHQASEMRGVLHDLAKAGYLAAAADYQRRAGTRWRESLFPWRNPADPRRVIDGCALIPMWTRGASGSSASRRAASSACSSPRTTAAPRSSTIR